MKDRRGISQKEWKLFDIRDDGSSWWDRHRECWRRRLYNTVNKRSTRLQGASKWYVNRVPTSPLASTIPAKYLSPFLFLSFALALLALRKLH